MRQQHKSEFTVDTFKGNLTEFADIREVPIEYSPDSLNWITQTSQRGIELRRGSKRLGQTDAGVGRVNGLGVGVRFDGVEVPFFAHGRKLKYYDRTTDDTAEVGTDLLPEAAANDIVSISAYENLAGAFVYASSRNSSIYKIPVANPDSAVDQSVSTYRGYFKFGQSRGFLFRRNGDTPGNEDVMGLYASKVDKVDLSQYPTQVTSESIGTSGSITYNHTLTQRSGARTVMHVTVTDGTETFTDDRNGNLVGDQGGTGTINYATGELTVNFASAASGAVTADYYYEDATVGGVCDFSISDVTNRQPGEGNYFPQFDGGGPLWSVYPLATVFYCFHELKTWQVSIPTDDESGTDSISTNLPFRERMGVRSVFCAYGGETGIYFINSADQTRPELMRLELYTGATQANIAAPKVLTELIDLSPYVFEKAAVYEWGEYVVLCCQQVKNGQTDEENTRMWVYNKISESFDLCDFPASVLTTYEGQLLAGDPLSNNVFTLFSGFDDNDHLIPNYYTGAESDLGIMGRKRFTRFVIEGLIQPSQQLEVSFAYDGGQYVEAITIDGNGSYVDTGQQVSVGSNTIGSKVVGGGSETEYANPYRVEVRVQSPQFNYVRPRFRALSGGYVSINKYSYVDIRQKGRRSLTERLAQ